MKIVDTKKKPRPRTVVLRDIPQGTVFTGRVEDAEDGVGTFIRGCVAFGTLIRLQDGLSWSGSEEVTILDYEPRNAELHFALG